MGDLTKDQVAAGLDRQLRKSQTGAQAGGGVQEGNSARCSCLRSPADEARPPLSRRQVSRRP